MSMKSEISTPIQGYDVAENNDQDIDTPEAQSHDLPRSVEASRTALANTSLIPHLRRHHYLRISPHVTAKSLWDSKGVQPCCPVSAGPVCPISHNRPHR